ncbi:MAG: NusG domain II-containing protein [Nitrospirota bacterium]
MNFIEILKSTTLADRVLFSTLIFLSLTGLFLVSSLVSDETSVEIEVNGRLVYVFPLDQPKTIPVQGTQGVTLVEIKNHQVRVIESPCRNKLCVKQGWVDYGIIACLPNKVLITVSKNRKKGSDHDAVTE